MTSLRVWTARLTYRGDDRLDITWKTGGTAGRAFGPTYSILMPALHARADAKELRAAGRKREAAEFEEAAWATYEPAYVALMRKSYRELPSAWRPLLEREEVTLVCYCPRRERCHRGLLAGILTKLGAQDMGERYVPPTSRAIP